MSLHAPFVWFGGKRKIAALAWDRFGDVSNYVEPFFGSGAVLLGRPEPFDGTETVNDRDGLLANFWRAVQHDPEAVAHYADWPVNENDLHARHVWLLKQMDDLPSRMDGAPDFFDAKIAGWWVWGINCWIGSGWCSGNGPWHEVDGQLVHLGNAGRGVHRQRVHLGDAGQGVHRKLVHLGNAGRGVHRQRVHLGDAGQGVHRKLVHLGNAGQGVHRKLVHLGNAGQGVQSTPLVEWMTALAERLRFVRVCCGDWARVCGPTPTVKQGTTAVLLDPPYSDDERKSDLYRTDDGGVSAQVRNWAVQWGDDPRMRIALCGYEGEHEMPDTWEMVRWKAHGGYGSQGDGQGRENANREVIWFSPHCLKLNRPRQYTLFEVTA